jgi:hypothetical protein
MVLKTASLAALSRMYGISVDALRAHRETHMSPEYRKRVYAAFDKEREAKENAAASRIVDRDRVDTVATLQRLSDECEKWLRRVDTPGEAVRVIAELRKQVELMAKIIGDLQPTKSVILADHPEWLRVRDVIFRVLDRHPSARADFVHELGDLAHARDDSQLMAP